ncbi:unnamed protein product [Spirodela intermedia]|uniref:Uncharacterized protein n=2 Tax=Spirodela intermedia TaxID=51605 RepID=A0A7I8IRT6_SPIIN|nr:unnamed protein product [Spirodela intermedia]CAA6660506.1 unnamed protein product [Spirodela intermedia]CAA7396855.1 unnamed protein product [Spirodela intermedia]
MSRSFILRFVQQDEALPHI